MTGMIPEMTKTKIEEKSREELIAMIHELMAEIERLKGGRTNSRNSSQPPSRDFKSDGARKRKRRKKVGAKKGHKKEERPLVDNPSKVIEVWAESCPQCQMNLLDRVSLSYMTWYFWQSKKEDGLKVQRMFQGVL